MLTRFRRHLNPPMVVSVIALFAALGGGYAMAFAGSGTLQKGSKTNLTGTFTPVRTLTGIGELQAACLLDTDGTYLRVRNSSGEALRVKFTNDDGGASGDDTIANNTTSGSSFGATGSPGTTRIHIWPDDGTKAPQAEIVVSTFPPTGSDCIGPTTTSAATALALNTQQ